MSKEQEPFVVMSPYSVIVDLIGNGGSLVFRWKGKEASLHFDSAADVAKAAEILNEHFFEYLNEAIKE